MLFSVVVILIPGVISGFWFYNNIWTQLPELEEMEDISFSQTTTITDRNGEILYELFEENREYIEFDEISEHAINALVSAEDQHFWTNPGIDITGIIRAAIHDITHLGQDLQGGSTLTQQLIKNVLLTDDRTIERKLQEIVLAVQLNDYLKSSIQESYQGLSEEELDKKVKQRILELYTNYIFYGNNAYGIEAASQTYFGKSAKDLDIIQGAILASLPRSPGAVNPYNNTNVLMGEIQVEKNNEIIDKTPELKDSIINEISNKLENFDDKLIQDTRDAANQIRELLRFETTIDNQTYNIRYNMGRTDIVLMRMYDDGYITQEEAIESLIKGLDYDFNKSSVDIKAPHFVFLVIQRLQEEFGAETLLKGGLNVKTTLDYKKQLIAKESIKENMEAVEDMGGNNSSMIYMDSENGDILAYVGSKDYWNEEIDGNVDIVKSNRQPGSALKPFVYAHSFDEHPFTPDTPVYDIPMEIGSNEPQNSDGNFQGLIPIKEALAHSRNIPAIQMFFALGEQSGILELFEGLGFTTFDEDRDYGYPLVIGGGETRMIDLANAYAHLSSGGQPGEINPIKEIRSPNGSLLYRKSTQTQERVISAGAAYLTNDILSTAENMPPAWRNNFYMSGLTLGTKTGTSNIRKDGEILPRDGWFASYTPSRVSVFWAGNTRGEAMDPGTFGGRINAGAWRKFFETLLEEEKISDEDFQEAGSRSTSISKITGKKASSDTPTTLISNTRGNIRNMPEEEDTSIQSIQVDGLCNGQIHEYTPESDIETAYIISPESVLPNQRDFKDINKRWEEEGTEQFSQNLGRTVLLEEPSQYCEEREKIQEIGTIEVNGQVEINDEEIVIHYDIESPFEIKNMEMLFGDNIIKEKEPNEKTVQGEYKFSKPSGEDGSFDVTINATDEFNYEDSWEDIVNLGNQ
ncbi:transglycosylase domain-containing protein [Candidatus Absconditicoccus praedator]|uniref:transglycosylase domain-containing protein n=1 Tax=Candidatus Absconditicoccus praedator TaxID=2735562 RepID=UPI001E63A6BC|nr:transglycosylase domain-containing protein [Candidatus Absconditicoccus praedator]UFX83073.1 penicillin-binding protein [Candidatus Absconditicoccus praedator]